MASNTLDVVAEGRLQLRLRLPFSWDCIESVRQAVSAVIAASLNDQLLAEQMAMVASELLENAVKHGEPGPIELCVEETDGQLDIALGNAIDPDCASLEQLCARIDFIRLFPSAKEAYLAALSAVYEQGLASSSSTQSTLGLARIAAEGECLLQCRISRPGWLTVSALRRIPPQQAHAHPVGEETAQ